MHRFFDVPASLLAKVRDLAEAESETRQESATTSSEQPQRLVS
jgi:hypothetical protein